MLKNFISIALFAKLPYAVLLSLDFSGFYSAESFIKTLRADLENKLRHYVVSYKANICNLDTPLKSHLCALIKGADLNSKQLALLNKYEQISKKYNVTFVIYQKPIQYMDPYTSAIAQLYKKYNKL